MLAHRHLLTSLLILFITTIGGGWMLFFADSASALTYEVNSTADTDDAACNTSPDCTLREAINAANASPGADVITFDPSVFDPFSAAIISLDTVLPEIGPELTIDGTGAGVIIEPSAGTTIQWGFFVRDDDALADTDFELINITARGFKNDPGDDTVPGTPNAPDGDAVYVCGDDTTVACGTDPVVGVTLDGVTAYGNSGDGLDVDGDGTDDINVDGSDLYGLSGDGVNVCCGTDVSITNSSISALFDAIVVMGGGAAGANVDITGNASIMGGRYGIQLLLCTSTSATCAGTTNDVLIDDNGAIVGSSNEGISTVICQEQLCDGSSNRVSITENDYVTNASSGDDAIAVAVCTTGAADCDDTTNSVNIDDNTEITGHYRGISIDVCTFLDGGCAGSVNTVTVDDNDLLRSGQDDTVDVEVCLTFTSSTGCGDSGGPHMISVSNNTLITGADGDENLNLELCRGDNPCNSTTASITIDGNGEINGADNTIDVGLCETCDGTTVNFSVTDNGPISSGEEDVIEASVCTVSCNSIASPQALSSVVVDISRNDTITGADRDQAIRLNVCTGEFGCSGLDNGGSPLIIPVSVLIEDNDTMWGGDDVLELDQCTSGPCDYANVSLTVTGHPGGLNAVEDETFDIDQCSFYDVAPSSSCSFGDVTIDISNNGFMSAGDDAEVFDVEQCSLGALCEMGTHTISIMDNGELDSVNQIFEGSQCSTGDPGTGCPNSTNTFIFANHPLLRAGDDEVVELDQCTFFDIDGILINVDTVGCNDSTNTVSITGNGDSYGADDSFDIEQCRSSGADDATDNGCDNSTNLVEIMDNGDAFNSDEGIFFVAQCIAQADVDGARACHDSTNTIRITGNGDGVATDGDEVADIDQCSGLGCDQSDNYVIFNNNGHGNSDSDVVEVDQCQMFENNAVGCNDGINSIEVTGNGDMLGESEEVINVDQCTGEYGSCNESMITMLVDDNGFLWGGQADDQAFEVDQCTFTICDQSDVSLTITDHPGIIGQDGVFNLDICSFNTTVPITLESVPGSCSGTDIDVVLERNGELQALAGDGLGADICVEALCNVLTGSASTIDVSLKDHLGIGPADSDEVVTMRLCSGLEAGCSGISGTRMPVNVTIDNNGPLSGTQQGIDAEMCAFGSSICDYVDIDFIVTNHPSISGLSREVFSFRVCTGLLDLTPDGVGSCANTTVDLNLDDNGDLFSGPDDDQGVYVEVCYDNASVDFCDNLGVVLNYTDNGPLTAGGAGIHVVGGESTALVSPYTLEANIQRNTEITGLNGHGINLRGFFLGGSIDHNTIVGLGHHTDDDFAGPVQFVQHDGINFGEVREEEEANPEADVHDMEIRDNTIRGSHGRGINLGDTGNSNEILDNTIERNGGAGVAIIGAAIGGTDVSGNTIRDNGGTGVLIVDSPGNTIGPNNIITGNGTGGTGVVVLGAGADGNTITQNTMSKNIGLGIDLNDDGVTANDGGDPDSGPNEELNFPENLVVNGNNLEGDACVGCTVEVFLTDSPPDNSGHGEGAIYKGSATENGSGDFTFGLVGIGCTGTARVTTTATDAAGNTSEFSSNVNISSFCGTPTASPTQSPAPSVCPTPSGPTARPTRTPLGGTSAPSGPPVPSCGPTLTPTPTPTPTGTGTGTGTGTATSTATQSPTPTPTPSPTPSPTIVTPTPNPNGTATPRPTRTPNS